MIFKGRNQVPFYYSCYGYTRGNGTVWHGGLDIVGLDDKTIYMPAYNGKSITGKVVQSRIVTDTSDLTWEWGYYVSVQLDAGQTTDGVNYLYFTHNSQNLVSVGQSVTTGDVLAIMGNSGNAAYADPPIEHVHFEARAYIGARGSDPTPYAGIPNEVGIYGDSVTLPPEPEYRSKILDISYYQPTVDYAKTAADIDGVILRIGLTYWGAYNQGKDSSFDTHYAGFKAQNTPVGCYYYSAADTLERAEEEALYCIQLMKGLQFELPVFYDVENNERQGSLSKELLTAIVEKFCSIVQSEGYFVGYYSYTSWIKAKFDYEKLSRYWTLWKADYTDNPDTSIPCDMLQYTNQGTVAGISGNVDLNECYRDYEAEIKANGLNGFSKTDYEPTAYIIGFASQGDVAMLTAILEKQNVQFTVKDGYITTEPIADETLANELISKTQALNIPYETYSYEEPDSDCEELQKEVEALQEQLDTLMENIKEITVLLEKITESMNELIGA